MFDAMKRHAIQVLKKAGLAIDEIARVTQTSRRSVIRIGQEIPIAVTPLIVTESGKRSVGRPSKAAPFSGEIAGILKEAPDLPSVEVLRRLREKGYTGGKSALYELVAQLRPEKPENPVVRFEGVAAEFSQHDFGHVRVEYDNGHKETVHFFASRLKFSRWAHVVLVASERVEPLIRAFLLSLEAFGGVPLVCVFDNPKTIALRHEGPLIDWNPTFAQVPLDFRFAAELCTPGRGQEKGAVENLVKWVKGSFFKVRRFHDRADLERQLAEWLKETNELRPSRATGVTPLARIREERERLRPLPCSPGDYALKVPITVGVTAMVEYEKIRYSMPAKSIGMPGTLYLYPDRVRIVARHFDAEHPRRPSVGMTCYRPEHRAQLLAEVSGERGKLYLKRQQIFELGQPAMDLLTEIVHARPRTWKGDVEKLHELLVARGPQPMLVAIREAMVRRLFGAEYVADLIREIA
jgi:transposase